MDTTTAVTEPICRISGDAHSPTPTPIHAVTKPTEAYTVTVQHPLKIPWGLHPAERAPPPGRKGRSHKNALSGERSRDAPDKGPKGTGAMGSPRRGSTGRPSASSGAASAAAHQLVTPARWSAVPGRGPGRGMGGGGAVPTSPDAGGPAGRQAWGGRSEEMGDNWGGRQQKG